MRKFGTDKPRFMEFTLGASKKVYRFPLASSMPLAVSLRVSKAMESQSDTATLEVIIDLFGKYLGEDVANALTRAQAEEILAAWMEESAADGASVGE